MRFLNIHHARETVARLAGALEGEHPTSDGLPAAYRRMITGMRPIAPPAQGIRVSFKQDTWGRNLINNKTFENVLEGLEDTDEDDRIAWGRDFKSAVVHTRALNADLGALVDLVVTDVVLFTSRNKGGGSSSHLPGLISMSPGPDWEVHDFAESIVHETVHLNVFLADMAYRLYTLPTKVLEADQHRVLSAVKIGQMRPLDKAFHSAVVAPPLMFMQALRGETELVDKLRPSLRACTDGLLDKIDCFTPYGQVLVRELRDFTDDYDMDRVAASISGREFAHWDLTPAA